MASEPILISVVIPCYKSSGTIADVVAEVESALEARADDYAYEMILVNDGSPDEGATIAKLRELAADDPHIVVVNLARNFGQQSALMAGFHHIRGEIVVVMDDDMQTPGDEICKLIDPVVNEDYDIAYADYAKRHHAGYRNLGSKFNEWCSHRFMGVPEGLYTENYFAVKRLCIDNALRYDNPYPYLDGLLFESIGSWTTVPITHRAREVGESGYTLKSLIGLWLDGFTAFSVKPLRAATIVGLLFAIFGAIGIVALILQHFLDPTMTEGWGSLMATVLFIGGLLMLMMGMLGEYVGRIYLSINNMPQYVIREVIDRRGPVDNGGGRV